MLQFKISLKCSTVHKYTLIMTAVSLVLTFLSQINKMNFIGTVYIISAILLGKLLHIKYALSISGTGCVFDLFYLLFHTSDSKWVYIRCVHFVVHLLTFLYETVWLVSVYCYVKQEEAILAANNERRSRIDRPAADPETPSGPKSPEKTDAPPPPGSGSTVTVADASPPDGKAASGTAGTQPVDKNVENRTGPEKAPSARDGKPAENDDDESARKPEKPPPPPPSGAAEPRPEENAAGVRKPDEPGDREPADERPEKPPTTN